MKVFRTRNISEVSIEETDIVINNEIQFEEHNTAEETPLSIEEKVDNMTQEEMESIIKFDIYKSDKDESWCLVMGYCSIGGCDMFIEKYDNYMTALSIGTIRTLRKVKPYSGTCNECLRDLQNAEAERDNERVLIEGELADLKGTGSKILNIVEAKCLVLRPFYDST